MKKLLITLMLVSPFSFADWGDVYFCTITSWTNTIASGEQETLRAGTPFKFHLNKEKNAMIFDNATPFAFVELKVSEPWQSSPKLNEVWYANDNSSTLIFHEGLLVHARVVLNRSITKHATCDKFE